MDRWPGGSTSNPTHDTSQENDERNQQFHKHPQFPTTQTMIQTPPQQSHPISHIFDQLLGKIHVTHSKLPTHTTTCHNAGVWRWPSWARGMSPLPCMPTPGVSSARHRNHLRVCLWRFVITPQSSSPLFPLLVTSPFSTATVLRSPEVRVTWPVSFPGKYSSPIFFLAFDLYRAIG